MALVFRGKSECPLCGEILEEGQEIFATSPFIEDTNHRLWQYHDAGMHQACFMSWPDREEFVALYNERYSRHYRGMRFMHADGSIEEREPRPGGAV